MSITIITPVYNGAAHIRPTLESLLQQKGKADFEHVVMDSCSKDGTGDIVREYEGKYGVQLLSEKDDGLYDAIAKGLSRAKGDIFCWINAGDTYMPWTLSVVEKVFAANPDIEWISGVPSIFFEEQQTLELSMIPPAFNRWVIRKGYHNGRDLPYLQQESMFWRRSLWERSGADRLLRGQGRGKGYAMDYHLWKLFAQHAELKTVRSVLAAFSVAEGQISEKFRAEYSRECGVENPVPKPLWRTTYPWMVYSFLRVHKTINVRRLK